MARKTKEALPARLVPGQRYRSQQGAEFECLMVADSGAAMLRSVMSGATFTAESVDMYEDGSISWRGVRDLCYEEAK